MPRGGIRRTSGQGRPKGSLGKVTSEVRLLAQKFGPMAVMKLAKLAGLILDKNGDPIGMSTQDTVQVMAINSLLDRAYGKSKQPVEQLGEDGNVVNPGQQVFVLQIQR